MAQEQEQHATSDSADAEALETATEETIALCGGDARAAVKALLVANAYLEDELAMAVPAVSYGFSKGWHARKRRGGTQ